MSYPSYPFLSLFLLYITTRLPDDVEGFARACTDAIVATVQFTICNPADIAPWCVVIIMY